MVAHTTADYDTAYGGFAVRGPGRSPTCSTPCRPLPTAPPAWWARPWTPRSCKVELICDGVHIHPSVVRAVFQMFGSKRVILISDTMRAAGMPDGDYTLGGQDVSR